VQQAPLGGVFGAEQAHGRAPLRVHRVEQLARRRAARDAGDGHAQQRRVALGTAPEEAGHEARAPPFLLPAVPLVDLDVPVAHLLRERALVGAHGRVAQLQVELAARDVRDGRGGHRRVG
jgi:hypothetical protein